SGGAFPARSQSRAVVRLAPLFCSKDYMSFKRPCPLARYNRTSYFYPTFSESSEHSHLLVSPVLVASAVIGVVIILSCITIIVGSIRRDRQNRLQRHRHRHHRHHHHHRRRHRHRHREYEPGYVSDGHTYSRSSRRMRSTCSPAEDWPPPLDISSDGDVDATVLRELYPDSPPGYEECVGPGATQLYVPTDAPPPYSLTDSCPTLNGTLHSGSSRSPGGHQQEQRSRGQGGLRTISMDTLPPYEADIINSMVTTLFMIIVSVLALIPETTMLTILGGCWLKATGPAREGQVRKPTMNPEDSKQEPTAPPEAWKQPEPTTLQPGRSMRSVYIVPSASKPSVSKPPAAKPSVSGPSVVKPSVSKPSVSKPLSVKPSVSKPPAAKPSESKSPAPKPVAPQPVAPQQPKKAAASAPSELLKPSQAEPSASKAPREGPRKHAEPPELSKTAPQEEPAEHPVPRNLSEKVAIQKRAEGRAKVPSTFTDSLKHFCFSPTGLLKILRMILIIAAVVSFVVGQAHETFIAITIQEACIVLFFILIYMVTLQHLLVFLDWTLFVSVHFHNSNISFALGPKSKGPPQGKTTELS
ncbi:Protein BEAN1, partial [Sciurus carolinensis]|nr:Protein BEAN1 [Sciurus carolinensis]